ncbi:uncharacterized protein LOC129235538 [Anastrepha obliqua]|uniref:uncharacterized protein LOC129235538 n=1 Tax=Anastrepha obliqua TaxID=95512 RepID=UPI0024098A1F|nr:uncharacterized protein LOC129235538 [Anastrepha obliqua]
MCDKSLFACDTVTVTRTTTATAIAIAVLALCVMPAAANSYVSPTDSLESLPTAAEVQLTAALTKIDNFLQYSLPEKMRSEGEAIRAEAIQELERCVQLVTGKEDVWRFRQCCGEELGRTMKQLALLTKQAYSGAGATVTHAFWWSLLILVAFM